MENEYTQREGSHAKTDTEIRERQVQERVRCMDTKNYDSHYLKTRVTQARVLPWSPEGKPALKLPSLHEKTFLLGHCVLSNPLAGVLACSPSAESPQAPGDN